MKNSEQELKPCPCCNGTDIRTYSVERPDFYTATASCFGCGLEVTRRQQSCGDAILSAHDTWNTRPTPAPKKGE